MYGKHLLLSVSLLFIVGCGEEDPADLALRELSTDFIKNVNSLDMLLLAKEHDIEREGNIQEAIRDLQEHPFWGGLVESANKYPEMYSLRLGLHVRRTDDEEILLDWGNVRDQYIKTAKNAHRFSSVYYRTGNRIAQFIAYSVVLFLLIHFLGQLLDSVRKGFF